MGNVYAEIIVKNAVEFKLARNGQMAENDVHTVTLNALVDTGATTLIINEDIFKQLGLSVVDTSDISLAGGAEMEAKVADPVRIQWKNRFVTVDPMVLPAGEPLLGVVPLEIMDLIVEPKKQELVGAHGDKKVLMAM